VISRCSRISLDLNGSVLASEQKGHLSREDIKNAGSTEIYACQVFG